MPFSHVSDYAITKTNRKKKIKSRYEIGGNDRPFQKKHYRSNEKLPALKSPPQVIISFNEYVNMDAVQFAKQLKIKVNKDVLFASYANLPITGYTSYPPVVSVEQYPYKQGEKAMEMMMKLLQCKNDINSADNDYHDEVLPASLIHH